MDESVVEGVCSEGNNNFSFCMIPYEKLLQEYLRTIAFPGDFVTQNISLAKADFGYQTQISAVYSANIEGNTLDVNSFMNQRQIKKKFKPKEVDEIEHLIGAYTFAQKNRLNEDSFLQTHNICSQTLLSVNQRGKYRNQSVGVYNQNGLVYLAIEPKNVKREMGDFWKQVRDLLTQNMGSEEVFFYAAFLHLRFVHIHPFSDGNGRVARLFEKWFLAEKLGKNLWNIHSEKYYLNHREQYYENVNLGVNFYELDYEKSLPFLLMLPNCISS